MVIGRRLAWFFVLAIGCSEISWQDEITRGMREMCKTKAISLWVVFAAQIFLGVEEAEGIHHDGGSMSNQVLEDHMRTTSALLRIVHSRAAPGNRKIDRERP